MKLTTLFTYTFFATSIFASPTSERWAKQQESRDLPGELFHVGSPVDFGNVTFAPAGGSNVATNNWAGAAYGSPPVAGQAYELVTGQFTVPTASGISSVVSIWVGIDGYGNNIAIQGGIYITTDANGAATYQSWSEWYPDAPVFYDQGTFAFSPGDVLIIGIAVSAGATTADFIIENQTTGINLDITFSTTNTANAAIGQTVEWIVERPGSLTLMNFGTVDFSNTVAQTASQGVDLSNADTLAIRRSPTDNIIIAQGVKTGSNSLTITYLGP
ncbi:concanavalin A-like lectin/glucanase [Hyaloscypha hepaticicola]|uniref:Concanavalin A-like lectin/glucanase n=1 Tax=Hyaloscypha hepaticicola TaxID=2082293 RepID=A0A2J6PUW2_9HELO|nr:concanavalin A-like lectin/glucanase [Hyaloscypha hepaticicola]